MIHYKNFHLRNESLIDTEAIREKCEELFTGADMPETPPSIHFDQLVRLIIVVTRIQHRWTCYLWQQKLQHEEDAEVMHIDQEAVTAAAEAAANGTPLQPYSSMYSIENPSLPLSTSFHGGKVFYFF